MITRNACESFTLWQETDDGIPEPPIVFNIYNGTFSMEQGGNEIMLNYSTIREMARVLKEYKDHE